MIDRSICGAISEEMIDSILADSFPASDPPPWTTGRENQRYSGCVDDSSERRQVALMRDSKKGTLLGRAISVPIRAAAGL